MFMHFYIDVYSINSSKTYYYVPIPAINNIFTTRVHIINDFYILKNTIWKYTSFQIILRTSE